MKGRWIAVGMMILLVAMVMIAVESEGAERTVSPTSIHADYSTIYDAMNASDPGDTIYVWDGFYEEYAPWNTYMINITKSLSLVGNGTSTWINGKLNIPNFRINVSWVNISDMRITGNITTGWSGLNTGPGIYITNGSNNCTISNNTITHANQALMVSSTRPFIDTPAEYICDITIENNTFDHFQEGIKIIGNTSRIIVRNNTISDTFGRGIHIDSFDDGGSASNITIENNLIMVNQSYVSTQNTGIFISIGGFQDNITIRNNIIQNCYYGVIIQSGNDNVSVINNTLINNSIDGRVFDTHYWNNNYYDNYTVPDIDFDGIVDTPYDYLGVYDLNPRVVPIGDSITYVRGTYQTAVIDGILDGSEYDNGESYVFLEDATTWGGSVANLSVYIVNDEEYIYFLLDCEAQNESIGDSYTELIIDVDGDRISDTRQEPVVWNYYDFASEDLWMSPWADYQARDHNGFWGLADDNVTYNTSVRGVDGDAVFGPSPNNSTNHVVMEYRLPLVVDGLYDMIENRTILFIIDGYGDTFPEWDSTNLGNNNWTTVTTTSGDWNSYILAISDAPNPDIFVVSPQSDRPEQIDLEDDVAPEDEGDGDMDGVSPSGISSFSVAFVIIFIVLIAVVLRFSWKKLGGGEDD